MTFKILLKYIHDLDNICQNKNVRRETLIPITYSLESHARMPNLVREER